MTLWIVGLLVVVPMSLTGLLILWGRRACQGLAVQLSAAFRSDLDEAIGSLRRHLSAQRDAEIQAEAERLASLPIGSFLPDDRTMQEVERATVAATARYLSTPSPSGPLSPPSATRSGRAPWPLAASRTGGR